MSFAASLRDQVISTRSGREPQVQIYLTKDEMKVFRPKLMPQEYTLYIDIRLYIEV